MHKTAEAPAFAALLGLLYFFSVYPKVGTNSLFSKRWRVFFALIRFKYSAIQFVVIVLARRWAIVGGTFPQKVKLFFFYIKKRWKTLFRVENELKRYTVQSHLKFSDEEYINDESQMKLRKSLAECIIKTNDYLSKSLEEDRYPLVAERPTEEYALDSAIKLLNQFLKFNSSYESDEIGGADILNWSSLR